MSTYVAGTSSDGYASLAGAAANAWPSFLPQFGDASILDKIWVQPPQVLGDPAQIGFSTRFLIDEELALSIPGLDSIALTIAATDGGSAVGLDVEILPDLRITVEAIPIGLRFSQDLLKPARRAADGSGYEVDPTRPYVELTLGSVGLEVDGDSNIALTGGIDIDLPAAMIGDSGVVIEAKDIRLYLDASTPREPDIGDASAVTSSPSWVLCLPIASAMTSNLASAAVFGGVALTDARFCV